MNRFFFCRLAVQQLSNKHFGVSIAPRPHIKADDIAALLHCQQLNEAISCFSISVCFYVLNVTLCLQICFPHCVLSMYSTTSNNRQEEWQLSLPHKQMYVITCNLSWKLNSSSLVGCEHSAPLQQQTAESAWSLARGKNALPFKLMGGRMQILSFHNLMRRKKWPVRGGAADKAYLLCAGQASCFTGYRFRTDETDAANTGRNAKQAVWQAAWKGQLYLLNSQCRAHWWLSPTPHASAPRCLCSVKGEKQVMTS